MAAENTELKELMESRSQMYNMLGRVFMEEIDAATLKELRSMRFPRNTGNADIDAAYLDLYKFLRRPAESVLDDLAIDFARTFLGVGDMEARAAYPFESVYTSPRGLLMQDARDQVLAIYKSEHLERVLRSLNNEGEDHLSLELLFMREMAIRTAAALESGDEDLAVSNLLTQRNFLNDHLLNWTHMWADDVPLYTKQAFYPAFARLLMAFLLEERDLLAELVGEDPEAAKAEESSDDTTAPATE